MPKKREKTLTVPKYIRASAKTLSFISDKWATKFAFKLFVTPVRFPIPEREKPMDTFSVKVPMVLPRCKKDILVYENGNGAKRALVIHGWNGRGTQLFAVVKKLVQRDHTVISFDAPGHGKSSKAMTHMIDFIEAAFELEKKYGPFDVVVGHSLGGMTAINAISRGLKAQKAVIIGSGNLINDIIADFIKSIGLPPKINNKLKNYFEAKLDNKIEYYNVNKQAEKVQIPVLVIHDKDDKDVSYKAAENIHQHLPNGTLMITERLGHRKILGDEKVLQTIVNFVQ